MSHNRAYKEKSSIKLTEKKGRFSPRADASVEPANRISLDADEFDRFEKCMTSPRTPSSLMQEAINQHKALLKS